MQNISFTSSNIIDNGIIPRYMGPTSDGRISNVYFNSFNVKKAMLKQKNKSSSGPDGLPPILFKESAQTLSQPLKLCFTVYNCF